MRRKTSRSRAIGELRQLLTSILILIGLALLLSAASGRSGEPSDQHQAANIKGARNQEYPRSSPVGTLGDLNSSHRASNETTNYTYNYYYPTPKAWLTTIGDNASIVFAGLLAVFTLGLWVTSHRQWRAAHNALLVSERAYIYVYGVEVVEPIEEGRCPSVIVRYRNTGRTPARFFNSSVLTYIKKDITERIHTIADETPEKTLQDHKSTEEWLTRGVVLPPDADFVGRSFLGKPIKSQIVSATDVAEVKDRRKWWFVVSVISYRDIFDTVHAIHELFLWNVVSKQFERRDWAEASEVAE